MKSELFDKYCKGELKAIGTYSNSAFSGIKIICFTHNIDDKVFGVRVYPHNGGEIEIPFYVKINSNGKSFRMGGITYKFSDIRMCN